MVNEIAHSVILVIAVAFSFLFAKTGLKNYDLQFTAGLFIFFYLAKKFLLPKNPVSRLLESVIFTLVVLVLVNTTGGSSSPFFFLVYFLLFSLSLLLEPIIAITVSLTLIIFFLFELGENQSLKTLLPVFSLAFLTPFALFMGQEYLKNIKLQKKLIRTKEDSFLFLSLMLKNHLKNISEAVENFLGDHELEKIKKSTRGIEKLIDDYERSI